MNNMTFIIYIIQILLIGILFIIIIKRLPAKQIKEIITYFNKSDLTAINNDCEFDKNEIAQNFEKILIHKIKY